MVFIMSNLKILALGLMVALSAVSASASVEIPSRDVQIPTR
jgi:hypothetical protein